MLSGDDLAIVLFFLSLAFGFGLESMKAETVARRVVFGAISAACLFTGVFWLQIQKIWPPFTAATVSIGTNPLAWFIVLMFILAVFAFHQPKNRNTPQREAVVQAPPATATVAVISPPLQRIFIDVSPGYLIDLFKNRTSIQGDALAAAYLGKWIVVTGKVRDIYEAGEALMAQVYDNDERFISARFSKENSEKVSQLAHGTTIKVRGEIYEIDGGRVRLRQCEIDQVG
jgi:tRNA_anti-like